MLSTLSSTEKVDLLNIALMLLSCGIAFMMPFELFLFSYAVFGPLHYLTEISWLHDNKYYANRSYDAIVLCVLAIIVTTFAIVGLLGKANTNQITGVMFYIIFFTALLFVVAKSNHYRILGLVLILLTSKLGDKYGLFFAIFLPTLVHVFIFTVFFMLYGTIKSKSRIGMAAIITLFICTWLLLNYYTTAENYQVSDYARKNYSLFKAINTTWLVNFTGVRPATPKFNWDKEIFESVNGILVMRFIAFAYTYHYLNWFSKTNIIKWNNVPRLRMVAIMAIWLLSMALYWKDFRLGLFWLLLISNLHVLLELPLNFRSMLLLVGYKSNN